MDKRCSFLVLIGCLIERLPKTCVPSSKLCFVRLAIAKLTKIVSSFFWPVLDLCQVFRNLPTRKLQPCLSINFTGFPEGMPRWVCKSTDGHKQKFKNCTCKCRSKNVTGSAPGFSFFRGDRIFFGTCHTVDIARVFQCKNVRALLLKKIQLLSGETLYLGDRNLWKKSTVYWNLLLQSRNLSFLFNDCSDSFAPHFWASHRRHGRLGDIALCARTRPVTPWSRRGRPVQFDYTNCISQWIGHGSNIYRFTWKLVF